MLKTKEFLTKMILTTRWRWSLCLTAVVFILLYYSLSLSDQHSPFSEINKQSTSSQRSSEYPSSQKIYKDINKIKDNYNENIDSIMKKSIKTNEGSDFSTEESQTKGNANLVVPIQCHGDLVNCSLIESTEIDILTNSATSAKIFSGEKIRTFSEEKIRFKGKIAPTESNEEKLASSGKENKNQLGCVKWAVVTTIFAPPSEAVRRLLYRKEWCVVVVGDKEKPGKDYYLETTMENRIIFLSAEDQIKMSSKFVSNLPWHSFARKNVGYLYAIAQGAKIIFDFDDDNILKFFIKDASPDPVLDIDNFYEYGSKDTSVGIIEHIVSEAATAYNPYPNLGAPSLPCWPRGLPLHMIHDKVSEKYSVVNTTIKFGVLQSLADVQPDVDAIYRLTKETPFNFKRPMPIPSPAEQRELHKSPVNPKPIVKVPSHTLSPYNAQATLHFQDAFWGLYLPITVAGRVSDIWRSYIVQALFKRLDLHLGFLPRPVVVQDRNPHSYEGDFNAEIPLYTKSSFLVSYLIQNYVKDNSMGKSSSLIEMLESLWVDMYERGIVEEEDVLNIQEWISDLLKIGYKFPAVLPFADSSHKNNLLNSYKMLESSKNMKAIQQIINTGRRINEVSSKLTNVNEIESQATKKCNSELHKVTFGCSGLHDGPRTDYPSILSNLGQTFVNVGPRIPPFRNYPSLKNLPGLVLTNEDPSDPLKLYLSHSTELDPSWPKINKDHYMRNPTVKSIDAFICSFPASMCQLWAPFNKTTIFLPAHRYNLGRCSVTEWKKLDKFVNEIAESEPHSGNTIGAASRYDLEYMKYYTGLTPKLISSFAGYYISNKNYKPLPTNELIIISQSPYFDDTLQSSLQPEFNALNIYKKYPHYKQEDIGRHTAVILFPYSVMSYKITEIYASATPMFVPSPKFYMNFYDPRSKQYGLGMDRTSTSKPYCQNNPDIEVKMRPLPNNTKSTHVYSPNIDLLEDAESEQYWIQFSDFYDWPHIQHFDSYDHLKHLLHNSDFQKIHKNMQSEIILREKQVRSEWCQIINRIDKYRNKVK